MATFSSKTLATATLALLATAAGAATQDLSVSATVDSVCTFSTAARTLPFGTLDPSAAADQTGVATSGAIQYKCTNGVTPATLSVNNGLYVDSGNRRLKRTTPATNDYMIYTLSVTNPVATAGQGFSAGKERTITITGGLAGAQYEDALYGTYTDTVTITVAP